VSEDCNYLHRFIIRGSGDGSTNLGGGTTLVASVIQVKFESIIDRKCSKTYRFFKTEKSYFAWTGNFLLTNEAYPQVVRLAIPYYAMAIQAGVTIPILNGRNSIRCELNGDTERFDVFASNATISIPWWTKCPYSLHRSFGAVYYNIRDKLGI